MRYADILDAITGNTATPAVRRWAGNSLAEIADGKVVMPVVRHPLGFLCYAVERSGELGVCFHIWDKAARDFRPTTSEIHSHSWDLVSHVLSGSVRNTLIDARPATSSPTHRLFEVRSRGNVDELRATERYVRCSTAGVEIYGSDSTYTLPAGTFHTSAVDNLAVTVVLGRGVPGAADLTAAPVDMSSHQVRRLACSTSEAAEAAGAALGQLAS